MPSNICQALLLAVVAFSTVTLQNPIAAEDATEQATAVNADLAFDAAYEAMANDAPNRANVIMAAQAAALSLYSGKESVADYLEQQLKETAVAAKVAHAENAPRPQRRIAKRRNVVRDTTGVAAADTSQDSCTGFLSFLEPSVCEAVQQKAADAVKDYDSSSSTSDSSPGSSSSSSDTTTKDAGPPGYPWSILGYNYGYPYSGYPYPYSGYPYPYGSGSPYGGVCVASDGPGKTGCGDVSTGYICDATYQTLSYCQAATSYSVQATYVIKKCNHYFCCTANNDGSCGSCSC